MAGQYIMSKGIFVKGVVIFFAFICILLLIPYCGWADFPIVKGGTARAVLAIGADASAAERHAANELAYYVQKMTGVRLQIQTPGRIPQSPERGVIVIGRVVTNPVVTQLVKEGVVRLSAEEPGLDGYIIQTVESGQPGVSNRQQVLVLGGSRDRGTLYAVYDLLARYAHAGFFWDAERIAHLESFVIQGI